MTTPCWVAWYRRPGQPWTVAATAGSEAEARTLLDVFLGQQAWRFVDTWIGPGRGRDGHGSGAAGGQGVEGEPMNTLTRSPAVTHPVTLQSLAELPALCFVLD
jgi:hypothetical protein